MKFFAASLRRDQKRNLTVEIAHKGTTRQHLGMGVPHKINLPPVITTTSSFLVADTRDTRG